MVVTKLYAISYMETWFMILRYLYIATSHSYYSLGHDDAAPSLSDTAHVITGESVFEVIPNQS